MQISLDHVHITYLSTDGSEHCVMFYLNDIAFNGSLDKLVNRLRSYGWTIKSIDFARIWSKQKGVFMECIVFESSRYQHYEMRDVFSEDWLPCCEKTFDDCVVRFRSCYQSRYEGKYQVFHDLTIDCDTFRRY